MKFLQKRIDEHRKVCYYIIKLRENKQNKQRRRTKKCINTKNQFIVYSEETLKGWAEAERKAKEFAEKHSFETVKDYEVAGYTIRCIQRKYDKCMNKENEYGVQVWADKPENVSLENVFESCVSNRWFNNPTEANEHFKQVKEMCY